MSQLMQTRELVRGGRRGRLLQFVETEPGMEPVSSYQWQWSIAEHYAAIAAAPGGTLRIELDLPDPAPPLRALALQTDLPGNLRFARRARGHSLLADAPFDGEAGLSRNLDEIRAGLLFALGARPVVAASEPLAAGDVHTAIDELGWADDALVRFEGGWELRPRLHGDAVPVQATIVGDGLRFSRAVVTGGDDGDTWDAVAEQALRFNAQLRHARLTIADETVFAEARLPRRELTPVRLNAAARAVAVAGRHAESVLRILASNPGVAAAYTAMFASTPHQKGRTQSSPD